MQKNQDPLKTLSYLRDNFLIKTEKHFVYSNEMLVETYNYAADVIKELSLLRKNKLETFDYLDLLLVHRINNFEQCDFLLFKTWILQSLNKCRTYAYAYNYLAQIENRKEGVVMFEPIIISDLELYRLLDKKHDNDEKQSGDNLYKKLKVKQIALIYVYKNKQITLENASQICSEFGYNSKTSGKGLYDDYLVFSKRLNRRAIPDPPSKTKIINKINLFNGILDCLEPSEKEELIKDVNELNIKMEEFYE